MIASPPIDGASFGPEALKVIGEAFDIAWKSVAANFGDEPRYVEMARSKLAEVLLAVADERVRDADALAIAALQVMAKSYRW
jgi:hypothetical protein